MRKQWRSQTERDHGHSVCPSNSKEIFLPTKFPCRRKETQSSGVLAYNVPNHATNSCGKSRRKNIGPILQHLNDWKIKICSQMKEKASHSTLYPTPNKKCRWATQPQTSQEKQVDRLIREVLQQNNRKQLNLGMRICRSPRFDRNLKTPPPSRQYFGSIVAPRQYFGSIVAPMQYLGSIATNRCYERSRKDTLALRNRFKIQTQTARHSNFRKSRQTSREGRHKTIVNDILPWDSTTTGYQSMNPTLFKTIM